MDLLGNSMKIYKTVQGKSAQGQILFTAPLYRSDTVSMKWNEIYVKTRGNTRHLFNSRICRSVKEGKS